MRFRLGPSPKSSRTYSESHQTIGPFISTSKIYFSLSKDVVLRRTKIWHNVSISIKIYLFFLDMSSCGGCIYDASRRFCRGRGRDTPAGPRAHHADGANTDGIARQCIGAILQASLQWLREGELKFTAKSAVQMQYTNRVVKKKMRKLRFSRNFFTHLFAKK